MIPIEEVEKTIAGYGYLFSKPKKMVPSYYRVVEDGTIIEALVRVESVIQDIKDPTGSGVRTSNSVKSYVPKNNRRPERFVQFNPTDLTSGIIEEDVKTEELSSEFSGYELSDGATISIRTIVNQVNKTKFYSQDGEPVYSVITTPIIKYRGKKQNNFTKS